MTHKSPKVLLLDIETAPLVSYTWALFDQNVALNQIQRDWFILSWAAKFLGEKKVMYQDVRKLKIVDNDKTILQGIWDLLDQSDIVITQNGKKFDIKKLNARFILNGMKPPSSFRQIDTLVLAKKHFAFTSNKLEYMSDKLCAKYKKLKVKQFQGFELWSECLKGNQAAFKQMQLYNCMDVLALEELYKKLIPWEASINFSVYVDNKHHVCSCGNTKVMLNGFFYSSVGRYQRYKCTKCFREVKSRRNLIANTKALE